MSKQLTPDNSRRITTVLHNHHKRYLEDVAHYSRSTEREVLYYILDKYISDHPLIDDRLVLHE